MDSIYRKYITTTAMIWISCLVLFVFAYLLVLKPQSQLKNKLRKQLAEKKQTYETTLAASTEEAQKKLSKEIQDVRDELRGYVTDSEGSANLTFDISQIAGETKVSSFSIKSKNSHGGVVIPQCKYIAENQMNISFGGGFNQFASFLNFMERHQPVIFVDWFSIKRPREGAIGNDINMGLSVFVEKRQDS